MIDPFVGLKVGYHNHAQEFVADIDGINGYEYFASLLDDEVALELDLFWAATAAGKHVWSEKPISVDRESGRAPLAQAADAGLLVGVAPDTVLGPGVQTARRAIAERQHR